MPHFEKGIEVKEPEEQKVNAMKAAVLSFKNAFDFDKGYATTEWPVERVAKGETPEEDEDLDRKRNYYLMCSQLDGRLPKDILIASCKAYEDRLVACTKFKGPSLEIRKYHYILDTVEPDPSLKLKITPLEKEKKV